MGKRIYAYNGEIIGTASGALAIENLTEENVRYGVNVGGVVGTFQGDVDSAIAPIIDGTVTTINNSQATKVMSYKFYNDKTLTSVILSNATSVDPRAFYGCDLLNSVSIPNATTIGQYAFYGDIFLASVNLQSVISIDQNAFMYCNALTSISLPSATSIGYQSFYQCAYLSSVNLGSATSIGGQAFSACSYLYSITLGANQVCSISNTNSIPASSGQHITIYVPSNLIESYKVATNWSTLYNNGYIEFQAIS